MTSLRKHPRIFTAALFHETHAFLDGKTTWDDFVVREGEEMLAVRGDASPMGGFLQFAREAGWDVAPAISAMASPSATVCDAAIEHYWERLAEHARTQLDLGVDAIYVVLHGAFASERLDDVDGEVLRRLRSLSGMEQLPLFGVYDLHANFTSAMADNADCLLAYRENPHADARQTALRAARLLQRRLQTGVRTKQYAARPPLMLAPTATGSDAQPMKGWLMHARDLERRFPEFWGVNVNGGFAYADSRDVGVSFSIVSQGEAQVAHAALEELTSRAMGDAGVAEIADLPVDDAFSLLQKTLGERRKAGPVLLVEPSDNIGGGAPGDSTTLLRALLERGVSNAAVCLWDPQAVQRLEKVIAGGVEAGALVRLELGGRGSRLSDGPIDGLWEIVRTFDGLFELEDKQSHLASMCGDRFDMGRCAIVRSGGVTLLLTSRRTPPMDLGQWRHAGLPPEAFDVMVVKAAVAHRKAYDPIAAAQIWVDTPGPCSSRLGQFPYRAIRRPIFPLDPDRHERLQRPTAT